MQPQQYRIKLAALMALALFQFAGNAMAMDAEIAEQLVKSSTCLTCHDVKIKKIGPAYHDVAMKYKGDSAALTKIEKHITTGPMVKMPSGQMAKHMIIRSSDPAQVKNVAEWVLSR